MIIKMTVDQVVALESAVAAPRGPNAVWLPMPAKRSRNIAALATLQQHYDDQKKTDNHVNSRNQINQP